MSPIFGFHLNDDAELRVQAETMQEAIRLAEEQSGAIVLRGQRIS
jgi:hypothetical protein